MPTRRQLLGSLAFAGGAAFLAGRGASAAHAEGETSGAGERPKPADRPYTPVVTPNGSTLPWTMKDGVKEFRLVAEQVEREFAPGMKVKCWGYNGQTPGPTIEAMEGDRVRILVTNRLPEPTTVHWHGLLLPSGMDGVGGLSQPRIQPGETFAYEFELRQHGTQMYHPHADETLQLAVGMMGMFVIHPREPEDPPIDRDFTIMLHEWAIHPGTYRPDPAVMNDFNTFTFNSKIFPAIDSLVARTGERVRVRFGNLSMDEHPIHLHGHHFRVTGTDAGRIPPSAQWPETTVLVPVGSTRDIELVAAAGDWALHCHKSHHTMNAMSHQLPNNLGVSQNGLTDKIQSLLPGYIAMGESGMAEHMEHLGGGTATGKSEMKMSGMDATKGMATLHHGMHGMGGLKGPANTLPMMLGKGPFGSIEMGGMFTVLKVRDGVESFKDPGWYSNPQGTVARRVSGT